MINEELSRHWLPRRRVLECTTWAEVRALGEEIYTEVLGRAGYDDFDTYMAHFEITGTAPSLAPSPVDEAEHALKNTAGAPADDAKFYAYDDLPACADGDWPPSAYRLVADSLPADLLARFGTTWETNFNGVFAVLEAERREELIAELTSRGFHVEESAQIADLIDF